jgi:hypothetical protein
MAKASYVWSGSEWVAVASAVPQTHQRGIATVTTTTYTLGVNDTGKALLTTNSSPVTITIPADSTYNFSVGQTFVVSQTGTGAVTIAAAVGVTLNSKSSYVNLSGRYAEARLLKTASNTWLLSGDLSA